MSIQLHGSAGWIALGQVSGAVPAAPDQRELLALPVAVGSYDGVRVGDDQATLPVVVTAVQVVPILLDLAAGGLFPGAPSADTDRVNRGPGEPSGTTRYRRRGGCRSTSILRRVFLLARVPDPSCHGPFSEGS